MESGMDRKRILVVDDNELFRIRLWKHSAGRGI